MTYYCLGDACNSDSANRGCQPEEDKTGASRPSRNGLSCFSSLPPPLTSPPRDWTPTAPDTAEAPGEAGRSL